MYVVTSRSIIEPHPIKKQDFEEVSDYFIKEVIDTGIKVA